MSSTHVLREDPVRVLHRQRACQNLGPGFPAYATLRRAGRWNHSGMTHFCCFVFVGHPLIPSPLSIQPLEGIQNVYQLRLCAVLELSSGFATTQGSHHERFMRSDPSQHVIASVFCEVPLLDSAYRRDSQSGTIYPEQHVQIVPLLDSA